MFIAVANFVAAPTGEPNLCIWCIVQGLCPHTPSIGFLSEVLLRACVAHTRRTLMVYGCLLLDNSCSWYILQQECFLVMEQLQDELHGDAG